MPSGWHPQASAVSQGEWPAIARSCRPQRPPSARPQRGIRYLMILWSYADCLRRGVSKWRVESTIPEHAIVGACDLARAPQTKELYIPQRVDESSVSTSDGVPRGKRHVHEAGEENEQ